MLTVFNSKTLFFVRILTIGSLKFCKFADSKIHGYTTSTLNLIVRFALNTYNNSWACYYHK
jgi:hypothetical protein